MGCATSVTQKGDSGVYIKTDRMYVNTQVGVSFKVPDGWSRTKPHHNIFDIAFIADKSIKYGAKSSINKAYINVDITNARTSNTKTSLNYLISRTEKTSETIKLKSAEDKDFKYYDYVINKPNKEIKFPHLITSSEMIYIHHWEPPLTEKRKVISKEYLISCYDNKKIFVIGFSLSFWAPGLSAQYKHDFNTMIDSFLAHYK